ncbi:MAG: 23S rRNA (pseudouridine(1915)-N(3))-methyltransferase RlmH [archaeon]|nr:23S rRNA (pseudouridine(1915)-N(3))-methyltransferase RlmH [Nanoarchaeota archaeon]
MIKVISLGKVKKDYVKAGIAEFVKRIGKYTKIEYIETNAFTERDLKGFVIALDVKGTQYSSEKFAEMFNKTYMENKPLVFLIGGPDGMFLNMLEDKIDMRISLSKMTFPNELVNVIFLEQLYRAFTIQNNEPYHRG